ncbi:MAG: hypothetical protein K8S24_04910 [Candidatus Aegiribacteria sp.]|nr:hypothetical protein [Candidatus Aegiribacteria sp.]
MTLFILISLLFNIGVPVYNLPATSVSSDIIVVMMENGLLPEEPWEGITPWQREEFWSLACSGMMIQRAGWSGYIIICPSGAGGEILETALTLASAECVPDNSALRAGLQLAPVSDCSSTVLLFSSRGNDTLPDNLPLRTSQWLSLEADTLMVNSPEEGNAFFWTDFPDSIDLLSAAWRGVGTEIVPAGSASVKLAFTCVHGSVPSNLSGINIEPHLLDTHYMETWGRAISSVESLIVDLYPLREDSDHLLWIRGNGTEKPWRTSPSPLPPPSARYQVEMTMHPIAEHPLRDFNASNIPFAVEIKLPGCLSDPQRGPVMKAILERIIGRDVLSGFENEIHFDVEYDIMGKVSIWLINGDGSAIQDTHRSEVFERLRNSILVPPGNTLISNAVVRASYLEGEPLDSIGVRDVSMELMNIVYPDQ